tara:strand:- start:701 stop:1012 length:312 start_codon:yes stop_codon:yes gene_type:complete
MSDKVKTHHDVDIVPRPPPSLKVTPEMEILTPQTSFKVEVACPKCSKGTLVVNGNTWDSIMLDDIYYGHTCSKCDHGTYMTKSYPTIEMRCGGDKILDSSQMT